MVICTPYFVNSKLLLIHLKIIIQYKKLVVSQTQDWWQTQQILEVSTGEFT